MGKNRRLTLEYGLRWEYHPPFSDAGSDITNFDPGVPVTGRVIIPSSPAAQKLTAPGFVLTINACPAPAAQGLPCTPFLTAKQAGFPESLRFSWKKDFNPRFGFAFRPFNDNKTVIRGGFGIYTMLVLGNGRFGNAGAGTLGPGTTNLSLGLAKEFAIKERVRLKFQGTFTNLPNHPNLNDPGTDITSLSFGRITTARGADSGGSRIGQFALRIEF